MLFLAELFPIDFTTSICPGYLLSGVSKTGCGVSLAKLDSSVGNDGRQIDSRE